MSELERLRAVNAALLSALEPAYEILGAIPHDWPGRHTANGQALLRAMRDAISVATDRYPEEVQDDYCNRYLRARSAK